MLLLCAMLDEQAGKTFKVEVLRESGEHATLWVTSEEVSKRS